MRKDQIALQLYTVREHTAKDMLGTLRTLARMGYPSVELAGYGNATPKDIRAVLDETGMRAVSAHVGLQLWQNQPQQVIDDMHTLGCEYAVVPFVGEEYRGSVAAVQRLAEQLNQFATTCQSAGLRFGYHNHAFEFAPLDGTTMWQVLADNTDPALVNLELDVYWAYFAGADPLAVIRQYAARLPLIHVKDMDKDARRDAPAGAGRMPWNEIIAASDAAGAAYYIVEQDTPDDPLADVEKSLRYLEQVAGA